MNNIILVIYLVLTIVGLVIAGYNWMYKREIHRTEGQVGITVPASILQLISAIMIISLSLSVISFAMFFISFLQR